MSVLVQRLFDGIAPRYDTLNHVLSAGRDRGWRRRAAKLADLSLELPSSQSNEGRIILDLCGGTGDFLRAVLDHAQPRLVTPLGIIGDFSVPMLRGAADKFSRQDGSIKRIAVDALRLPFRPLSFDAVFCGYGMRNLDNWRLGIKHVLDLLKPGGIFVTLEFFKPENLVTRLFYGGLAPLAIPLLGGLLSRREAYQYLVESIRAFAPVGDYAAACQAVGFASAKIVACDFGITHIVLARKPGPA